jgi:uncharacterized protein YuzE
MKKEYFQESDMLYIKLSDKVSKRQKEMMKDFVIDTNESGNIVGIEIEHASKHVNNNQIITKNIKEILLVLRAA